MKYDLILVRPGEIWLKGNNRQDFVRRVRRNLQSQVRAICPTATVEAPYGRFLVHMPPEADVRRLVQACSETPGVTSVSPCIAVPSDKDQIIAAALALAKEAWAGRHDTFAALVKRSWKGFPVSSPEISRLAGEAIIRELNLPVDLRHSVLTLGIEIHESETYIYAERVKAVGGLPIGSAGRVMLLLSGGIDSPVAGYLAQKRGCELDAVYFHSPPLIGEQSREKVEKLAKVLSPRQGGLRLHVAYFTSIQKAIHDSCNHRFTVLLYRRFMYRIAARLAAKRRCLALCTGENLGQVASQTLENIALVDCATDFWTLRPLVTYDKLEIIGIARKLGTYDTSTLPFDDCCTLFLPKNPATKASLEDILAEEAKLDVEALINEAIEKTEIVTLD